MNYILWGATGQALVLRELLFQERLLAIFDNNKLACSPWPDAPICHGEPGLRQWVAANNVVPAAVHAFLAVGGARGSDRLFLRNMLDQYGFRLSNAIHFRAFVALSATLGRACQVLAHASVCAGARIGDACIVNTAAVVEHGCVLEDGVHVGPNATIAGECHVGSCAFIGAGAVVLPRLSIGANAVIGAGAVVTRNVPDGAVVFGNPARIHNIDG